MSWDWGVTLKLLWPFLLIVFGLGGLLGWAISSLRAGDASPEQEAKLRHQVSELERHLAESNTDLNSHKAKLASLSSDYDSVRAMHDRLRTDYDAKLGAMIGTDDGLKKIAALESTLKDREAQLGHLSDRLKKVEPQLSAAKERIAELEMEHERKVKSAKKAAATPRKETRAPEQAASEQGAAIATLAAVEAAPTTDLCQLEGVDTIFEQQLIDAGVQSQMDLLETGKTRAGRKEISDVSGIPEALILTWVNQLDLMRIPGISPSTADFLELAGVDTVVELATRSASNLHTTLTNLRTERSLVAEVPELDDVKQWVKAAKDLPRVVTH